MASSQQPDGSGDLGDAVIAAIAAGRAAWPQISLPPAAFAAYVAERLPHGCADARGFAQLCGVDLYLACACVHGDPHALRALDALCSTVAASALRSMRLPAAQIAEVEQRVFARLAVGGPDGGGRLTSYAGKSKLSAWLQAAVVRQALNLIHEHDREVPTVDETLRELEVDSHDPELRLMKAELGGAFVAAFAEAAAALTARQRNLLRYHHVDRLNVDQIATVYRMHRATVARWLAQARVDLVTSTRRSLARRLDVRGVDLDHYMQLIESNLHVSVGRFL